MSDSLALRAPPHNTDAEKALIGCMMLNPGVCDELTARVDQFYSPALGHIFCTIMNMRQAGKLIDAVTLAEALIQRGLLEKVGGLAVVAELLEIVPHSAHAEHYAKIVREKWMLRKVIELSEEMRQDCCRSDADAEDVLARSVQRLSQMDDSSGNDGLVSLAESCESVLAQIRERNSSDVASGRILTGFEDLDCHLNGFRDTQMIVLAARPGMGKTALALNIATNVMKAGNAVLFVSLEMSHQELTERLLGCEAGVNTHDIISGKVSEHQMFQLEAKSTSLASQRFFYLDTTYNIAGITAKSRLAYRKHGVRFIVADYLQLVDSEQKRGMLREQAVAAVSREMKRLAMELKIPVLVLSQLNREVEKRNDKRPMLSDLRESGAIEQDANMVLMLHRPDAYDPEDRPGEAEVIIAKNRSGPTGIVRLTWRKEFMQFKTFRPMADNDFNL